MGVESSAIGAGDRWGSVAGTGVISCRPCGCKGHSYSRSVSMGQTDASEAEVLQMLRLLGSEWQSETYNLLSRSSCHFCDDLCQRLGVGALPTWVYGLADTGAELAAHVDTTCCREVAGQACQAAKHSWSTTSPEVPGISAIHDPFDEWPLSSSRPPVIVPL